MNAKGLTELEYKPDPMIYKAPDKTLWVEAKITMPEYIKGRAKGTVKQGIDGKYYRQVVMLCGDQRQYGAVLTYRYVGDKTNYLTCKAGVHGPLPLLGSAFFKDT